MMASRMLSRLLPVTEGDVSVYESIRRDADLDLESQRRNPHADRFHDEEEDDPDDMLYQAPADQERFRDVTSPGSRPQSQRTSAPAGMRLDGQDKKRVEEEEDVPESLLLEAQGKLAAARPPSSGEQAVGQTTAEAQWRAAQQEHRLHSSQIPRPGRRAAGRSSSAMARSRAAQQDPEADATWTFTNAGNLDAFLLEVYQYFAQHGVWSILLSRAVKQLTELFLFSFAMFLSTCIDYSKIPHSHKTSQVLIPKCMAKASWIKNAALFSFIVYWLYSFVVNTRDVGRLLKMREFYSHVLDIKDADIQTVEWIRIVNGLKKLQNANVATANFERRQKRYLDYRGVQQRLNEETVANRLMRQDNYYVAMFNKEIFDFSLPLPFLGTRYFYSKSLEWCIDFCLTNFIFDEQGNIRSFALDVKNRKALVSNLRRRLRFTAALSILFAPWNILRFCVTYFFRYYTEFSRNPSRVSIRTFTPLAEWKIREFNELEHIFQMRLRRAHPYANDYLKQFPKDKTDQLCRFVAFISGALAAVLALATLLDSELFLGFEITEGRTTVFWLTILVGIFGFAHGMLPEEHESHDPVFHLKEVLLFLHYTPSHWKDRLHTDEVRAEFSAMYQMKVLIFLEEILSLILAPLILLRNASHRSERIIDFFRETTVHVDGVGNQCNFAVFNFKKNPNVDDAAAVLHQPDGLRDDYYALKDDKMAASMQGFMHYYSHYGRRENGRRGWQPPPAWPPMSPRMVPEEGEPSHVPSRNTSHHHRREPRYPPDARSTYNVAQSRRPPPSARPSASATAKGHGISESRIMAQDSDLDDYDKAVGRESDTEAEESGTVRKEGVLGMVAQFTRAKTERGLDI